MQVLDWFFFLLSSFQKALRSWAICGHPIRFAVHSIDPAEPLTHALKEEKITTSRIISKLPDRILHSTY